MLTVPEAARRVGRNPETVRRWIREGKLRARKVGTQHVIDPADLERFVAPGRRVVGPAETGAPPDVRPGDPVPGTGQVRRDDPRRVAEGVAPYQATRDWLPAIVGRIVRLVDPVRIVLFGSRSAGDARPDSDYDLLVVLDDVGHRRRTRIEIARAISDLPVSSDIVVASSADVAPGARPRGALHWALLDGRAVYERPG